MKLSKPYLLLVPILFGANSLLAQKSKTIDVYLIGGQSNATGQGYMKNLPDTAHIDTAVWLFHSGQPYLNSGKPAYVWLPLHQASESPDRFGPELGFGSKIHQLYPKRKIALIKHALSGSSLYSDWKPGENVQDSITWGKQYKEFVRTVDRALAALRSQGYKPLIRGMVWQQGEADAAASDSISKQYAANLTHLIGRVRKQFKVPGMPFVYGYVLPPPNVGAGRDIVRKAEHDIDQDSKTPWAVKRAFVVETDDLSLRANDKNSPYPKDTRHFGTSGAWLLGVRMAQKMAVAQ